MRVVVSSLLIAVLSASALAQTRVGNIVITPAGKTPPVSGKTVRTTVPDGMREYRGRVVVRGGDVRLPAGSQVTVSVEEYGTARQTKVVNVTFGASRLSTPYQVYFNPVRLNAGTRYAIRAVVTDRAGNVLYASDPVLALPKAPRATLNLTVSAP